MGRLAKEGCDVDRPIILEAVITGGGFGVRLHQDKPSEEGGPPSEITEAPWQRVKAAPTTSR
jgi:hypothetical protein